MGIFITGDTHGDFSRLMEGACPALDQLSRQDLLDRKSVV